VKGMQVQLRAGVIAVFFAVFCHSAPAQDAPSKAAPAREAMNIAPRATPADYQAHAQAGNITIAAEFTGHSIATPEAVLSTESYVVVEVGLFGPPEARLKLSPDDFSLRINGKKTPVPAQPYALVSKSAKDPEWEASVPSQSKSKSKTSLGGDGNADDPPPAPVHMPIELRRAMEQRILKASLPEGERVLPEAGLIFFEHGGKVDNIRSIELIYTGAAGKATLELQP